ncbi:nuclear transport factor 2 family protein [Nocardia flavorosea]|uniref:Nuclear transport factor 2 family protein n=1 Tax=Nocardia flavorosea TaxID=53429 RepID=A0A846YGG4_9NOCA|nr:nuclear transport factor 2 family protein [Nocardia flavorosea]NKY58057.1 nuclear transport factor 2 family protein [Nocardia flavorosea]
MHLPARTPRLSRVAAATAAAVALALGSTACGSDDDTGTTATSSVAVTTSASAHDHGDDTEHGDSADAPTAQSLQSILEQITNPDVTVDEKVDLIVDGENRRGQLEQLNAALQNYRGLSYTVADITVDGDTATGQTTITSPRGSSAPPAPVTWEEDDGAWKLSDTGACLLLGFAQIPCAPA